MNDDPAGTSPTADLTFDEWYREAWPRVLRAVALFAGPASDPGDIAAEACARAYAAWDERRPADPTPWTVTVAFNLAKRRWRRTAAASPERLWDGRTAEHLGESDLDLWAAVQQLPRRAREAIALRYGCDLAEHEVASAMGIAPGTAAATLHQARRRLRSILSEGTTDD